MTTEVKLGRALMERVIVDHMEGRNPVVDVSMCTVAGS